MRSIANRSRSPFALLGVIALVASACGGPGATTAPSVAASPTAAATSGGAASPTAGATSGGAVDLTGASFTVGSKEFTEQLILGQITIQVLEAAGATVTDETGLIGSAVVREALTGDEIDMYWEYTGTGWINHLGNTAPVVGTEEQFIAVRDADEANGIVWLEPAPLNNTYAIAVASETATSMEVTTLSDLAANADGATLCAASEFLGRDDGLPGLEAAYGFEFSDVATLELGLIPDQIDSGENCVFGEVFATDSRIADLDLLVLEDDLSFFAVYEPSLNVRQEVFDANPGLAELFAPIAAALDTVTMQALNSRVDQGGENEADVAADFLAEMGLIDE
ncbi:MAG: glycine/betaine ABC transporter substrate-binding protein [Chloroflexi bacterium]|nr:glycine/betaine ABC transporter substrate-binding protein [Chloroflexota bacterium]